MPVTVYWFSGTGNSYAVAKGTAEGTGGKLVSIANAVRQEAVVPDTDRIGIVFPVYFGNLPNIIEVFAGKLRQLDSRYIFAVATYGGGRGGSFERLRELLRTNGGELAACFGVHLPQNAFRKFWEKPEPLYRNSQKMIKKICRGVENGVTGLHTTSWIVDVLQKLAYGMVENANRKFLVGTAKGTEDETSAELMYRLDCTFHTNDLCNGCGTCARVCPAGNIIIKESRPEWQHRCINCICCYNYCPNKAIESDMVKKGYYYHHPDFAPLNARREA